MSRANRSVVAAVVIVTTLSAGVIASRIFHPPSRLESALATMPAQTVVVNYTDWAAARAALHEPGVTSRSPAAARERLLRRAYDRDFSAASILSVFDAEMGPAFGWTVLDAEWEAYGQSREGAVDVLKMSADFDFAAADAALTRLGYPDADASGVRAGGPDLVASIASDLTPQLANVALLPDHRLVVASDNPAYAALTVDTISGLRDSVAESPGAAGMAAALTSEAVSAVVNVGPRGCKAAGFSDAGAAVRREVRQRISSIGGVEPLDGLTFGLDAASELIVVMRFANSQVAQAQEAPRTRLTRGEAPGQGGTFQERFRLVDSRVVGSNLILRLRPLSPDQQLLSDLDRGGLVFASC